jgi:hypothetical protein
MRLQQTRLKEQHQAEVNELQRQAIGDILDTVAARVSPSSELGNCSMIIMFLHILAGTNLCFPYSQVVDRTCGAGNMKGDTQGTPDLTNRRS